MCTNCSPNNKTYKILKSFTYAAIHTNLYGIIPEIIDYITLIGTFHSSKFKHLFFYSFHTLYYVPCARCCVYPYPYPYDYINYALMVPSMTYFILSTLFFCVRLAFSTKIPHYLCTFNILLNHYFATVFPVDIENFTFFSILPFGVCAFFSSSSCAGSRIDIIKIGWI